MTRNGRITVDPQGATVTIDVLENGVRSTVYTTAAGTVTVSLPVSISVVTELWVARLHAYTVVVAMNSVEIARREVGVSRQSTHDPMVSLTIEELSLGEAQDSLAGGGSGLPAGGTVGQVVTNTGPGVGDWEDAGSGLLQSATVQYTAADLHTFATDGAHTLVAAPGAGKMIVPERVVYEYKYGTVPFGATTLNDLGPVFGLAPSAFGSAASYQFWPQRTVFVLGGPGAPADFIEVSDFNVAWQDLAAVVLIDSTICTSGQGSQDVSVRRSTLDNAPLLIESGFDLDLGVPATVTISAAGSGYAVNDTLQAARDFPSTDIYGTDHFGPTFKVTTVGGGGAVTGVTMLSPGEIPAASGVGTVYSLDASSTGVSPQPGAGSGLQLTVASITQGDGSLYVTVDFRVIDLHL